jgi:nitroimidazol reductase NimA-like FMN-containing flavoprotein (pyridoxamine 5'-phosphate oxidase superfamily)
MNYRSAVLHGVTYPFPDDDKEAKMHAFKLVVESAAPGRWDHARQPDDSEVKQTGIIRMKVESAR